MHRRWGRVPVGWRIATVGAVAAAVVVAANVQQHHSQQELPPGVDGMRMVFDDEFDDSGTIDLTGTGAAGHQWYTDKPFSWKTAPASAISVSDGVLTIDPSVSGQNYQMGTASPRSRRGKGFHYGYFEARMAFDPDDAPGSDGFPAFWGLSYSQAMGAGRDRTVELDFFEAMHKSGASHIQYDDSFAGTVHELQLSSDADRANYGNNIASLTGTDWKQFHVYACLWQPGSIQWYFDGKLVLTQHYGANATPEPNASNLPRGTFGQLDTDAQGQMVILGTGSHYPLKVDWVRIHQ